MNILTTACKYCQEPAFIFIKPAICKQCALLKQLITKAPLVAIAMLQEHYSIK